MHNETYQKLIEYITKNKQASASDLVNYLDISKQALFKHHLSKALQNKDLTKIGKAPKVFYLLNEEKKKEEITIDYKIQQIIDDNYSIISSNGKRLNGFEGFCYWCDKNDLDIQKTAKEYIKTLKKYEAYRKNGLIDGMQKMKSTFKDVYLKKVYYLDFYSIERFGKTKLGQTLLYGKQSGNKKLIKEITLQTAPKIKELIIKHKIDAIGFVPWTVKREVQFMQELEKNLQLNLKKITIDKLKTEITIPQKTLSKLQDRIENTKNTIVVSEKGQYKNILLIDDAIGSGATLNGIAQQIKQKNIAKNVIGLAITGSFKGFDIISEV